ncbi:photosystem II reaction center W protein, chloroplastic-like [Mangifera indica]|uniref:photosystem II reaction center W protein, chloroplastic-like n=1 Tax=Mangifera indica TaxID=29780 RepID=UPI001CFC1CDB|nr:photosystem II reaction center W protein, chloroplastic-like [Mangifera indica]
MTIISASATTSSFTRTTLVHKPPTRPSASPVLGLPRMVMKGKLRCSMEGKQEDKSMLGMGASVLAAACAATMSKPAMALVDERMSTEGTGLPFGLSNNLLGWILLGVFGLIWALYFTYTTTLDEDEESGLSL